MSITSLDNLNLRIVEKGRHYKKNTILEFYIRDYGKNGIRLIVSRAAMDLIDDPDHLNVLIGDTVIAIQPTSDSPQSRRVIKTMGARSFVALTEARRLFPIQPGEGFRLPCTLIDGLLVAELPTED